MTIAMDDGWGGTGARGSAQPRLGLWIAASIIVHVLIVLAILIAPEPPDLTIADRESRDMPPVEVVSITELVRTAAPKPDFEVKTDRPDNALPPPARRIFEDESDLKARPDSPTHMGLEAIDPEAIREYLKKQEKSDRETVGTGMTWTTCSLLSPERRVLEPACDGLLIQRSLEPGVAASLQAPDDEVLEAIKRIQAQSPPPEPAKKDKVEDRSYRNEGDDYYGKRPWE